MISHLMKIICFLILCFSLESAMGQSMFLPQQNKHLPFLDRLEILLQKNTDLNVGSARTVPRYLAVFIAGMEDSTSGGATSARLSYVDKHNLQDLLLNNAEYVTREVPEKRTFFNNPANMVEVNRNKFFLAINPMFAVQQSFPADEGRNVGNQAVGLNFRTLINNNFGLYASFVRNYETPPLFIDEKYKEWNAVQGAGYFERSQDRYIFNDIRAGVTFKALKYFDFQIGLDRNFIGNGYRSLFLSDFGPNQLFAKVNTRVWRFKYQHLYSPLVPSFRGEREFKRPFGKKVVAMHHLSINATNWLNLAVFQALAITDNSDWKYMIPVMFYPIANLTDNEPENNLAGFEFKANVAKTAQFYGQILLDNVKWKEISGGNGWWNNRFGVQLGLKYINALGVDNLDLQLEMNAVRPYTYSTKDSAGTYSNYNQPLAHPMGANFFEGIGILRYQPHNKITASLRAIVWKQGLDTGAVNFGGNILKGSSTRPAEYGFTLPTGLSASGINTQLLVSYELRNNIFIDASLLLRKLTFEKNLRAESNTTLANIGIRMNMFRREYDYQ